MERRDGLHAGAAGTLDRVQFAGLRRAWIRNRRSSPRTCATHPDAIVRILPRHHRRHRRRWPAASSRRSPISRRSSAEHTLQRLIAHIHDKHPGVPVILDAKRGDIGSTAERYAAEAFDRYGADAVTLNPYLGGIPCSPSWIAPARAWSCSAAPPIPAPAISRTWTAAASRCTSALPRPSPTTGMTTGNCLLVVGATWPRELAEVRGDRRRHALAGTGHRRAGRRRRSSR